MSDGGQGPAPFTVAGILAAQAKRLRALHDRINRPEGEALDGTDTTEDAKGGSGTDT